MLTDALLLDSSLLANIDQDLDMAVCISFIILISGLAISLRLGSNLNETVAVYNLVLGVKPLRIGRLFVLHCRSITCRYRAIWRCERLVDDSLLVSIRDMTRSLQSHIYQPMR